MKVWLVRYQTPLGWQRIWFATKRDARKWRSEARGRSVIEVTRDPEAVSVQRNGAAIAGLLNMYGGT